jgi:hypothetical protein
MSNRGTYLLLHEGFAPRFAIGSANAAGFCQVPADSEPGHTCCIRQWLRSLHGMPSEIVTSGMDARGTVEVAQAAYESIRTGSVVRFPFRPRVD